jgi:general stress protein YciG
MDREKQRQIASKGGKAAHQKGTAHEFTPEEARVAGRKGGMAAHQKGTAHQFTPEEAAEAGRKGGRAAHQKSAARQTQPAPAPENQETNGARHQGREAMSRQSSHGPASGMPMPAQNPEMPAGEVMPAMNNP